MSDSVSRTAVIGAGGVGGLLGALMTRAGHHVVYVARSATVEVLNVEGVAVRSAQFGDFDAPARAVTQLHEPVDACLITVKATQLNAALAAMGPDVLGPAALVPFLNGFEHMTLLRRRYPAAQVAAGVIRVESTRVAPGRIEHTSPFCGVEIARHPGSPGAEILAGHLLRAGLAVTMRDDETAMLWDKLAFLAPLALLTTHGMAPVGTVRAERRDDLKALINEIVAVARAAGASVDAAMITKLFDQAPSGLKSSMLRDAEAGRITELDAIGGAVLRAAARHGVRVATTARLIDELTERGL